jgi:uncharacterized protein (TIGR02246 family)
MPEDWPRLFADRLNASDLDGVMELYESDASFVAHSGETLVGSDRIRESLADMIKAKTRLSSRVIRATIVGDIAQVYTDFDGTTDDTLGKTVPVQFKAIEVLRRQPDGIWKLIMGDPNGRAQD